MRSAHALTVLSEEFGRADTEFAEDLESLIGGAEITTTGLKVAVAAGAIAAVIATGGIAAEAEVGLLGTSLSIGGGAGLYAASSEAATQGGEMVAEQRKAWKFDYGTIAKRGAKEAVIGFVGALAGGALSKYAMSALAETVIARMGPEAASALAERLGVGVAELTPGLVLTRGNRLLIEFLSGTATTPLTTGVQVTLNSLGGQVPPSPWVFSKMVIENAVKGGLVQLFVMGLMHGAGRPGGQQGHEPAPKVSEEIDGAVDPGVGRRAATVT